MPRRLGTDLCELKIQDNISGSDITLFYRMPTTQERISYSNEGFQRKQNRLIFLLGQTRQKFGLQILMGIRDGDFEKEVGDKYRPVSSDLKSPHYDPEWKDHIKKYASDLIQLLAVHVFDTPAEMLDENDLGETEEASFSASTGSNDMQENIEKN